MTDQTTLFNDETNTTEVTITPDGRLFVFGTSRPILDVLEALQPDDATLQRLLNRVREHEQHHAESQSFDVRSPAR